jgi:Cytochrome b5-like Heme/Steroid binding domain
MTAILRVSLTSILLLALVLCCLNICWSEEEKVRIVTKEELALHDGNQTETLWLSIMSKVYDVTKGAEYYGQGAPYHIFVGRDGNVPFITGAFNPDEAEKPLTDLTPHQLFSLETWTEFYEKEEKYPFVGLLVGSLYDEDGNPTELMLKVQAMAAVGRAASDEQQRKSAELIAERKRKNAERAQIEEAATAQEMAEPNKDPGAPIVIEPLKNTEEL